MKALCRSLFDDWVYRVFGPFPPAPPFPNSTAHELRRVPLFRDGALPVAASCGAANCAWHRTISLSSGAASAYLDDRSDRRALLRAEPFRIRGLRARSCSSERHRGNGNDHAISRLTRIHRQLQSARAAEKDLRFELSFGYDERGRKARPEGLDHFSRSAFKDYDFGGQECTRTVRPSVEQMATRTR